MRKIIRRTLLIFALMLISSGVMAQKYKSFTLDKAPFDAKGLYYSLVQTELVFDVKVEKITEYKGCYADYSYLLGLKNIIISDGVYYRIKDIKISSRSIADSENTYFLTYDEKTDVKVSESGCLLSIGDVVNQKCDDKCVRSHKGHKAPKTSDTENISVKSTFEQRLLAQGMLESVPDMTAEKAVKQIEKLRERQIDILSGSVDGTYMNNTVEYMYKQLDAMIDSYVAMFAGERVVEELNYSFTVRPEKPLIVEQDLLVGIFKFSAQEGVKPLSYTGDMPTIVANLHSLNTTKEYAKLESQKSKDEKLQNKIAKKGVGVYYRIPEKVQVSIANGESIFSKTVDISQFGQITYTADSPSRIVFDSKTGALKYIGK